jgi:hypothetical protein
MNYFSKHKFNKEVSGKSNKANESMKHIIIKMTEITKQNNKHKNYKNF